MEEGLSQSDTVNIGDTFFLDAPADPDSGVYNRSGAALPVPDSLPDDWAGVPTDGLEYLFMVRCVLHVLCCWRAPSSFTHCLKIP